MDFARKFPPYGLFGIAFIFLSELLLFLGFKWAGQFFTPMVWTGYILLVDALNYRFAGSSLMTAGRREFLAMLPWSVICWLIFEAYNLRLCNWSYIQLPSDTFVRLFGYVWSFATIFPAILETADLLKKYFSFKREKSSIPRPYPPAPVMAAGAACLLIPLVLPQPAASKLFAVVWVGFFFLLDPVKGKGRSVIAQMLGGNYSTAASLAASGLLCGILWEFWNYRAVAKWVYTVPISFAGPKIFEMPLLGYLGFIPFAFECYAFQEFLVTLFPGLRVKAA